MSLYISDVVCGDICIPHCPVQEVLLSDAVWRGETGASTILVDGRTLDNTENIVVVLNSHGEALEYNYTTSLTPGVSICRSIKGLTLPVRGYRLELGEVDEVNRVEQVVYTRYNRHVALAIAHAAQGHVCGDEG